MVLPLRVVSTSPGLVAEPLGMFSVIGAQAVTGIRPPRAAMASTAASTAAAPPMSVFMVSMPVGRLQRQAARVEGDPLADQGQVGLAAVELVGIGGSVGRP